MSDALIFGAVNSEASNLANALSDVLHVPVRYKREPADDGRPGVAICVNAPSFTVDAGILVFADDVLKDPRTPDPDREAALGVLAEAALLGRYVAVISSKDEAKRWKALLKLEGASPRPPARRILIVGDLAEGDDSFGEHVAEAVRTPLARHEEPPVAEEQAATPEGATWLVRASHWRIAETLGAAADLVLYLDSPAGAGGKQRLDPPPKLHERLLLGALRKSVPISDERLLRRALSEFAHATPVLRIRNAAEREAVLTGITRAAAVAAPG